MKDRILDRTRRRNKRRLRIRKKISGTTERLRLSVFRSNKYIYGQLINDVDGKTLLSLSDCDASIQEYLKPEMKGKVARSFACGKALAKLALDKGITLISFDRGGHIFHGRIKAFAEGAREGGLKF